MDKKCKPRLLEKPCPFGDRDPITLRKKDRKKKPMGLSKEVENVKLFPIVPSLGTRIDLLTSKRQLPTNCPHELFPKYEIPKSKKERKDAIKRRENLEEELNFCKFPLLRLPSPTTNAKLEMTLEVSSAKIESMSVKVMPTKPSTTPSDLYPDPPKIEELALKEPKTGVIINEKIKKKRIRNKNKIEIEDYLQTPVYQPDLTDGSRISYHATSWLPKIIEENELLDEMDENLEQLDENEEQINEIEQYLMKSYRRKVDQASKSTSIQFDVVALDKSIGDDDFNKERINQTIQKFRRDTEEEEEEDKQKKKKVKKIKKGTFESHSFTKLKQTVIKDFYYGLKQGSFHQGDDHFTEFSRNQQGICMPIAAYCYTTLLHPTKWVSATIDAILEAGNSLYVECAGTRHIHNGGCGQLLTLRDLQKYCYIANRKIHFVVSEPEVSGMIRSHDKRVYNLTKAINIFFQRNNAGIFQTGSVSIALWKDRHYYFFDAASRNNNLQSTSSHDGTAVMAYLYGIPELASVLLDRSNLDDNDAFVIYSIQVFGLADKCTKETEEVFKDKDNYMVLDGEKAVLLGSYDLADKCFGFSRNKQALTMALIALIYSRITVSSAWNRQTIDKIMVIGNQLYLECAKLEQIIDIKLDNLPAEFTIGPYLVQILITPNKFIDLVFIKGQCRLHTCLEQFFAQNTNAIIHLGKSIIAVWVQRNVYFCFDPYSRNNEGFRCRNGAACVSMHRSLRSLSDTIAKNFDAKDVVFHIHALKLCQIHRDPSQSSRFSKHLTMGDYNLELFINCRMRKSWRSATVTVDQSHQLALTLPGQTPDASTQELGSDVTSLTSKQLPSMVQKFSFFKSKLNELDVDQIIADLDSPSLSDTQIEPTGPEQPDTETEVQLQDLDSFELTQEELELQGIGEDNEGEINRSKMARYMDEDENEEEMLEDINGGEDDGDDWYLSTFGYSQIGSCSLRSKISEEVNTDLSILPLPKEILNATNVNHTAMGDKNKKCLEVKPDDYGVEPDVTQKEELEKESNFVGMPDYSQVILGTKNMTAFGDAHDLEFMAPFVCVMATIVARKYSIITWSSDIIDYILKCGAELYQKSTIRFDQVYKFEIPRLSLGKQEFQVNVTYLFDGSIKDNTLAVAITQILFAQMDYGVLVTPTYACGLIYKNHLFYLFDGFGNNEVGLSRGANNDEEGVACLARFTNLGSLVGRILYNKAKRESNELIEYKRFVLSGCTIKLLPGQGKIEENNDDDVKEIELIKESGENFEDPTPSQNETKMTKQPATEKDPEIKVKAKKDPDNKIGYQYIKGVYTIQGTKALQNVDKVINTLKDDYFVCICACLMLMNCPLEKWSTRKVDQIIDQGQQICAKTTDLTITAKRIIKNILIDKNYFDIVAKTSQETNWTIFKAKKPAYFIIQFQNICYVIYRTKDDAFNLFDPYGKTLKPRQNCATWIKFWNFNRLRSCIRKTLVGQNESCCYHTFEVTAIRPAPKRALLANRLGQYKISGKTTKSPDDKIQGEDLKWLCINVVPWSTQYILSSPPEFWHNWQIMLKKHNDYLYALFGGFLHQFLSQDYFDEKHLGKQTFANFAVATAMMMIYDLSEWTCNILDSILFSGDKYFKNSIQQIKDTNYEMRMDDLLKEFTVFPYSFKVRFEPVVEGTMFLVRLKQFNLYKALRYFFDDHPQRSGVIVAVRGDCKRKVAFGKVQDAEYYMYDCETHGPPMFSVGHGVSYILRMNTLDRLLYVLTLTLRGGDFFIYSIEIDSMKAIN